MPHNGHKNSESVAEPVRKFKEKHYRRELKKLHVEIVKLQEWVKHEGLKVCIVFEGATAPARGARSRPSPSELALGYFAW